MCANLFEQYEKAPGMTGATNLSHASKPEITEGPLESCTFGTGPRHDSQPHQCEGSVQQFASHFMSESWLYKWLQGKGVHLAVNSEHVQTSLIHSDFMEAITREADHGCDDCRALILACFLLPLLLLILCITSAAKVRLRLLARCACRVSRRRTRPKN